MRILRLLVNAADKRNVPVGTYAPDSLAVVFSALVTGCVLAPTREREELRFFRIGPIDKVDRAAL